MTRTELAAIWPPTVSAAREAGHKPQSPLQAIEKCRDCSCYQLNEIRACEAVKCASGRSGLVGTLRGPKRENPRSLTPAAGARP